MEAEQERYPIGHFKPLDNISPAARANYSMEIARLVPTLQDMLRHLNVEELRMPYRKNGWTVQQVVHHLADNDMNALIRLKRALTEEEPQASSYREDLWAELNDYRDTPVQISVNLLESVHYRLMKVLDGLVPSDFEKRLSTEVLGMITVDIALQRFIWHNKHHAAQIRSVIERMK